VGGKRVDLKKITMPLLNYYGKYDHLVPPEACELLTSRVGSKDAEDICLDTGHIGIYVSSKCQKEFSPKIARWLKERDEDKTKHKTKKATPKKRIPKKTPKKATSSLKSKKDT
jgi:polyhydroxyalkanoate synthase